MTAGLERTSSRATSKPLIPGMEMSQTTTSGEARATSARTLGPSETAATTVHLAATAKSLRLSVRDYGQGFDVEAVRHEPETLGLLGMEERIRLFGGTLAIRSSPDRGTVVKITCPREAPQG